MRLTKDDIDAVSLILHVDGELTFSVLLTRGGLTQRFGSSDGSGPPAVMVKGRTDGCFEDFIAAMPDSVLDGGGDFEDGGRDGPRHDWKFELGGGMAALTWTIAYHQGSASLPDEFADMVVQAERLTHSWYLAGVAEETGQPLGAPSAPPPPAPKPRAASTAAKGKGSGPARPKTMGATASPRSANGLGDVQKWPAATKKRIALAVVLDFYVLSVPYMWLRALLPAGDGAGPPGAALVVFGFVEFALLQFLRKSPGYWMLGIRAPLGSSPRVDPVWPARESIVTMVLGALLFIGGASGLTSWTVSAPPTPYFGLPLGAVLSTLFTLLCAAGLVAAGLLILRLDLRGVWIGAGTVTLALLAILLGWEDWPAWIQVELQRQLAPDPRGSTAPGSAQDLAGFASVMRYVLVLVPTAYGVGLGLTWRRFTRRPTAAPRPAVAAR